MKATILSSIALLSLCAPAASAADPLQQTATAVFEKCAPHTLVITVTRKSGNDDKTFETTAVAADNEGLLVTSLSAIEGNNDIGSSMVLMMGDAPRDEAGELTRVAWIRDDASEVEGELVLTDQLLDLAIIRLTASEGATMPAAPEAAKTPPALLENTFGIGRLSANFQREPLIGLGHLSARITTPSELFVISGEYPAGIPVYNHLGKWIGLTVNIENKSVVVPASAILSRAESATKSE